MSGPARAEGPVAAGRGLSLDAAAGGGDTVCRREGIIVDYGHFSDDGREYVITCLPAPRPWENYLGNAEHEVVITKPKGMTEGSVAVAVDGSEQPGNVVPPHGDAKVHQVRVRLTPG